MCTYTGRLDVLPSNFPLKAERIILRQGEVAFDLRFEEQHKAGYEWTIDGTAMLHPDGYFICDDMDGDVQYSPGQSTIYFITANGDQEECRILGFWCIEDEGCWQFSGILERYRPTA